MRLFRRITALAAAGAVCLLAPLAAAPQAWAKTSIVVTATQIFGTIDPAKIKDYTEYMAAVNLYEGLTTVDPTGKVLPLLAEKWDISQDNKNYRFHLVKDATFSDGKPIRAKDVVYSLQRLIALNKGPAFLFAGLISPENVKAPDEHTVEISLNRVYAPFLATTPLILITNSEAVQAKAKDSDKWAEEFLANNAAGSGPFALGSYDRGGELVIVRNEKYHLGFPKKPIDEVRFIVTKDEATVKALAQRGQLGMSARAHATETFEALSKIKDYRIVRNSTASGFYLKLNHKAAPTDDIHIRRAIAFATDYKTIRDVLYPGIELRGPLPPAFGDAFASDLPAPEFNLEKAKAELKQSKYASGGKVPLVHSYVQSLQFEEEIGLLLKAALDQVGFDVKLQPEPWNRITELASKPETTPAMTQIFNGPTYPSPDSMFYVQYHSKGAGTWSSMSWAQQPEFDTLIDQARQETDVAKQNVIYKELQKKLVADQSDVYLLASNERQAMHRCLDGFTWVPIQSFGYNFGKFFWTCD
ncbi:ABC transporter substrate-binding protein [Reyranella sp.]|uniref:ABC transporter substrate-binding protein n=1 Tax=Reyranella sp. TaxID=1929291 RepID=UPI003D0F227C